MNALVLRLAGPLQSWGTQSRLEIRDTAREPSKSGVVGLLAAALGRPRSAAIDDLLALRMLVRVDSPGTVHRDYQTAGGGSIPGHKRYGVAKASGGAPSTVLSSRYYLCDADFRVALEGPDGSFLQRLADAVCAPRWPLFLGRKAFVPNPDLLCGVHLNTTGLDALRREPWCETTANGVRPERLKYVIELPTTDAEGEIRHDSVGRFDRRDYSLRRVRIEWHSLDPLSPSPEAADAPVENDS